jgi:hypothetical protein
VLVLFILLLIYGGGPALLVHGWVRWSARSGEQPAAAKASLIGFVLGNASAALAISSVVFSAGRGGFRYYDPLLLNIFRYGVLISLSGVCFSLAGMAGKSSLRWHAPGLSLIMSLFWVFAMAGE